MRKKRIGNLIVTAMMFLMTAGAAAAESPQEISARLMKNYQAMRSRKILVSPVPKELNFTGVPVNADRMVLVFPDGNELGKLAAGIINSRSVDFDGKKIAVSAVPVSGKYNVIIDTRFDPGIKKAQGYRLIPEASGIRLQGADRAGLLYAAVTARGQDRSAAAEYFPGERDPGPGGCDADGLQRYVRTAEDVNTSAHDCRPSDAGSRSIRSPNAA